MKASPVRAFTCGRVVSWSWKRAMSLWWMSISEWPWVIHSATARPTPGPSLIHTAAATQRPVTSLSPRIGAPSAVRESRPLIA